jgi:RND family efflux transporter MFP subunit
MMRCMPIIFLLAPAFAFSESYDCLIEPMQMVNLASPVTGLLDKVMVKRGDRITKGQVLASLESDAEKAAADLARYKSSLEGPSKLAESKIEFSERKFKRKRDMASEKLLSPQESDDAEAEYKQAQAELQVAKENLQVAGLEYRQQSSQLALRTIRSPFDGVVVDQMIYPGEVVEPGGNQQAILKVAQLNPLRVRVILPNKVFGKPTVGMPVEVTPEIAGLGKYAGKVRIVDRVVDAASGTFVIFVDLPNPKLEIPSGIKCRATFSGLASNMASLPPKAK